MGKMAGLDYIAAQYGDQQPGPAVGVQAAAGLEVVLGRLTAHLDHQERRRAKLWQSIRTVPIRAGALTNQVAASGTLDYPDRFGPHEGYWWDVVRLSMWGWTAGSVSVYINDPAGDLAATFSAPGQWTWSSQQMPLAPRDRLVVVATGVTGAVYVAGIAVEVEAAYWPEYVL